MYQYLPIENEAFSPYIGRYRTFGLRVLQVEEGEEREVMILPDVSTDFAFTLRLAGLCTQKQLSPLHLLDVLEDLL
nr:DUF6514 family protein [uncultured Oscillibacter sp.]